MPPFSVRVLIASLVVFGSSMVKADDDIPLFQPSDYPERLAARVCPFDVGSPERDNPEYLVTRFDDVELFAVRAVRPTNAEHRVGEILRNPEIEFTFADFAPFTLQASVKPPRNIGDVKRAIERRCVLQQKGVTGKRVEAQLELGLTRNNTTIWHTRSDVVTDSDVVSVRFVTTATLKTRAVAIGPLQQVDITKLLTRTRVPAVAFDKTDNERGATWEKLQILTDGRPVFDIDFSIWTFTPGKTTWASFQNGIETAAPANAEIILASRLLPRWYSYAVPGDRIELHRMENQGVGGGTVAVEQGQEPRKGEVAAATVREPRAWQYSMVVDPDGFVWIPPVNAAGNFSNVTTPIERQRISERDSAFFRVQLWTADRSRRFFVEELALALSVGGGTFNSYPLSGPCNSAICDSHIFENVQPTQRELSRVRYHAQIADLSWTLVASGQRATIPFRRGYRIDAALADGLRQIQHKTIDFGRKRYVVVVVPHVDRNPLANDAPFKMEFTPGMQPNPDDALVLPGDTVFVY